MTFQQFNKSTVDPKALSLISSNSAFKPITRPVHDNKMLVISNQQHDIKGPQPVYPQTVSNK